MMFTMDMPTVPAQGTPMVLAQADVAAGSTPEPDYILNVCKETDEFHDARSAYRAVDPAGMLKVYLQFRDKRKVELADIKNVTMVQDAAMGKISTVVDNTGRPWYRYDPNHGYLGDDKAIFMAELEGKRYKIIVQIKVEDVVIDNDPLCPPAKLIKVNKPSSGASGFGAGYRSGPASVVFKL